MQSFVPSEIPGAAEFGEVAATISDNGWTFGLFGGAARDIYLEGSEAEPRDFDLVVVGCPRLTDLRRAFWHYQPEVNGFSGLTFKHHGVPFDVWRLEDTWAFQRLGIKQPMLSDLLKTTFFNIEQIVIVSSGEHLIDSAFTRGFAERVLELNHRDNPFPLLAAIRTVTFVKRFGMTLGPRLQDWIAEQNPAMSESLVERIQTRYYGRRVVPVDDLRALVADACAASKARRCT